jgi:hypothetical protein
LEVADHGTADGTRACGNVLCGQGLDRLIRYDATGTANVLHVAVTACRRRTSGWRTSRAVPRLSSWALLSTALRNTGRSVEHLTGGALAGLTSRAHAAVPHLPRGALRRSTTGNTHLHVGVIELTGRAFGGVRATTTDDERSTCNEGGTSREAKHFQ